MTRCFNCQADNPPGAQACGSCGQEIFLRSEQSIYYLDGILGKGGFGIVYRARDSNGKLWAIKKNIESDPDSRQQFESEANTLSLLSHPHLTPVTDYFLFPPVQNGQQYFVMEYVVGRDLSEWLAQNGKASETQAFKWMQQILDAVDYLHTRPRPVIHRDIKPDNIRLLPGDQTVKLVDFGLIKMGGTLAPTKKAARGVTEGYSPPEQYGSGGTGPFSDVYALGAMLYTLLTLETPPQSIDRAYAGITLKPVRVLNPRVSPHTEQVIHKAMAIDSTHRYQTAGEMLQALLGPSPPQPHVPSIQTSSQPRVPFGTGPPPPVVENLVIEAAQTQTGDWVNSLRWNPNKNINTQYLVIRKYRTRPISAKDGQSLGTISTSYYEDRNPDIGVPLFYAVYAVNNGVLSETGAIRRAEMRLADVIGLKVARQGKNVVLSWSLPPNVYDVIIRRSEYERPFAAMSGDPILVQPRVSSNVVDTNPPKKSPLYYAVFCRFRDDTAGIWLTSKGEYTTVR